MFVSRFQEVCSLFPSSLFAKAVILPNISSGSKTDTDSHYWSVVKPNHEKIKPTREANFVFKIRQAKLILFLK